MDETIIETPCVKVCVLDLETGLCIGCGRSRDEIGGWLALSRDERRAVMAELPARLVSMAAERRRKGGARARRALLQAEADRP
ncbi:DUF1289 domain-containing protein [Rhodoligotrophos defluvii]|uniref:DUF1289 domain-containing protein n=1 Tax=Rhodoligotrophos defluvii TaxID=2561934 RepID=UPI0010C9E42F|nr:DUF1289 domain-containing protein [Rhodoligotrophos defluvii]